MAATSEGLETLFDTAAFRMYCMKVRWPATAFVTCAPFDEVPRGPLLPEGPAAQVFLAFICPRASSSGRLGPVWQACLNRRRRRLCRGHFLPAPGRRPAVNISRWPMHLQNEHPLGCICRLLPVCRCCPARSASRTTGQSAPLPTRASAPLAAPHTSLATQVGHALPCPALPSGATHMRLPRGRPDVECSARPVQPTASCPLSAVHSSTCSPPPHPPTNPPFRTPPCCPPSWQEWPAPP